MALTIRVPCRNVSIPVRQNSLRGFNPPHRRPGLRQNRTAGPVCKRSQRQSSIKASSDETEVHHSAHHHSTHRHGCCSATAPVSEDNVIHAALSKWLSSLTVLSVIEDLNHKRRGAVIAVTGLLCYLIPWPIVQGTLQSMGMAVVISVSGVPLFKRALLQLCLLDVNAAVLMSMSAVGSIYVGLAGEGLMLLILVQTAHLLESRFTDQSQMSLRSLLDTVPDQATVVQVHPTDGRPDMDTAQTYKASEVSVGTHVVVKPGEQVPLDGIVIDGTASVTLEHLSGESLPVLARPGSTLAAGSFNADGLLIIKTIATVEDSTPRRIAQLAVEAQSRKPDVERWIDGVTTVWSKCALLVAACVAVGCVALGVPFFEPRGALYRSLCIVTAAAPCSLVMTPLAYVCALTNASQR